MSTNTSPFYIPVDISHTALLISDVQTQILSRFPIEAQKSYLEHVLKLVNVFREYIKSARALDSAGSGGSHGVPLIVHQTLPFNLNNNAFVSPYNKLAKWVKSLEEQGFFSKTSSDPHHPDFAIPEVLKPEGGWGSSRDEIVIGKLQPNCFASSDLMKYLNARGIKHVVLIGLTTMGSILGSARAGADLDYHIICPRECIIDDDAEVDEFLMKRVLPKFVDVVQLHDMLSFNPGSVSEKGI
ncbi:Isochorismatase hydrolase [Phaeosphaeriaceae sp. SRC1lsM3a]|nr:Isochorismatase hydrolase [Stagonospora sp. SRC1lsM3a]